MSTDTPLEQRMLEAARKWLMKFIMVDDHIFEEDAQSLAALLTKEVKAARLDEMKMLTARVNKHGFSHFNDWRKQHIAELEAK